MNQSDANYNPLFYLLDAISLCNVKIPDYSCVEDEEMCQIVERGLLSQSKVTSKIKLQNLIISNQRKRSFIQKIDALKDIVQQKDEVKGIKSLASLINEIFNSSQKNIFLNELNGNIENVEHIQYPIVENPENDLYIDMYNPSYGGFPGESQYIIPAERYGLVSVSDEPQNSILQDENRIKLPIQVKYNPNEVYLIHKGIHYCRMLLRNFNERNDRIMLRELKSKEVLNIVLSEQINNDKDYISVLVDTFPNSLNEILFIFKEDKDEMFRSSFFVTLAMKNVKYLYDILLQLCKSIEKIVLSRACYHSHVNGTYLSSVVQQNNSTEMKGYVDTITRFLNRYN